MINYDDVPDLLIDNGNDPLDNFDVSVTVRVREAEDDPDDLIVSIYSLGLTNEGVAMVLRDALQAVLEEIKDERNDV